MPIRPFPLPLSIGTDICQISRIQALLNGTGMGNGRTKDLSSTVGRFASGTSGNFHRISAFLRRIFSPREQQLFWLRFKSVGAVYPQAETSESRSAGLAACSHLAGRFAAKEAAIKAFRAQGMLIGFWDIMILQQPSQSTNTVTHVRSRLPGRFFGILLDPEKKDQAHQLPKAWVDLHARKGSLDRHDRATLTQDDDDAASDADGYSLMARRHRHVFDELTKDLSGQKFQISISHDGDYATAMCLATHGPLPGDVGGEGAARMI